MSVLVTIGALALVALWAMSAYGRLVGLRNQVTKGWRQVAVQLKRRHELIANLVNTVTGAVEFEGDTLEAVVAARTRAASASGPADASRRESELSATLARFFALAQSHPELTANQNLRALQQDLAGNENTISAAVSAAASSQRNCGPAQADSIVNTASAVTRPNGSISTPNRHTATAITASGRM